MSVAGEDGEWPRLLGTLTDLLLAAFDLHLQRVLQVLLEALLGLDLLLEEEDLRLQLLLRVLGRRPQRHRVLAQPQDRGLELLGPPRPKSKHLFTRDVTVVHLFFFFSFSGFLRVRSELAFPDTQRVKSFVWKIELYGIGLNSLSVLHKFKGA